MWGSWLDQIQKKLDDVSGLAEQAIDSMCEEVEEEEERMVEYKKEEGGENQSQTKMTSALRNDRDCNVSSYPSVESHEQQHQQQGVQERKLPVSVNGVTDQHSSPHEAVTAMTAMAMTGSSDGNSVLPCNIPATTVEEEEPTDHMVTAVEGTEEGSPLDVDPSSLQSIQHMETCTSLTGAAAAEGTEEKETKEEETLVASEPNPSTATTTSVVIASVAHPDDVDFTTQKNTVFVHDGNDKRRTTVGNSEEQLLRFQRMLADEMEVSRALREEKNRLDHRIVTLEKELASLKLFKKNALHADPQKLEALEREGMELSTKLGKERERYKALYEKKKQLESQVASLEKNIAQFSAREDDFQKRIAASHADCEEAKRRADDLNAVLVEQEDNVRQLQHQLASAKRSNAELVAQHKMELFQQRMELDSQKENSSGALVSLQRERDALVSSLRRDQMEYERRVQQLEDKLLQANRRADQAESRLTDHERSALAPIRELRATMEDMERQKKQLKEEVEYWKKECSLMERSRQDEKEQFTQQISDMKSELQVMHSERLTLEQELQQSKGKHIQTRSALEKALERASYAEAVKEQLALTLEETRRRIHNGTMDNNNNTNAPPHAEMGRISINAPPSLDGSVTGIRLPLYHMDPSEGVNDVTGRGGRSRVEREVVRQAVEIERLRRVEEEGLEAKRKLSALASQHDLLMQMYGQLREEFQQGQRDQSSKINSLDLESFFSPLIQACVTTALGVALVWLLRILHSSRHAPSADTSTSPHGASASTLPRLAAEVEEGTVFLMGSVQYAQASKRRLAPHEKQSVGFTDQLLLLRHGERLDHVDRAWRTSSMLPETDPPLSAAGRQQALETGLFFLRKRHHGKVGQRVLGMLSLLLVSPFHRCIETALIVNIVGFDGRLAMFVDPLLAEWHSTKLFFRPPRLGGSYVFAADMLTFRPHWETLRSSLGSFFRSAGRGKEEGSDDDHATTTSTAQWLMVLDGLCARKPSFPLWTSAATEELLRQNWSSCSGRSDGGTQRVLSSSSSEFSGVSYPENAARILRRVGEAIELRFGMYASGEAVVDGVVPPRVKEAAQREAKQLPRRFVQRSLATSTAKKHNGVSLLLPPTRIMMVTHAEVVAMALKHCCPKSHGTDSRFSVPYCSLTSLSRLNNYYYSVLDKESSNTRMQEETKAASWCVEMTGSTDHLQTSIFLKYSKSNC